MIRKRRRADAVQSPLRICLHGGEPVAQSFEVQKLCGFSAIPKPRTAEFGLPKLRATHPNRRRDAAATTASSASASRGTPWRARTSHGPGPFGPRGATWMGAVVVMLTATVAPLAGLGVTDEGLMLHVDMGAASSQLKLMV